MNLTSLSSLKHDPIAATINLDRNKELYQTLKGDRAYFLATRVESNPTDTIINLEREQVFEWQIEELSNLRSIGRRIFELRRWSILKKQGFGWGIERGVNLLFVVTDAPIEATIYPKRNKGWSEWSKSDWAYFSAMNDDPNEATINLERSKRLNETFKSDRNYPSTMDFQSNLTGSIINLERKRDWMKNLRVIELTSQFVTYVSIETNIYTKTIKGLNEKSNRSDLLFVGHRCFNEDIDLSSEKQKSELNIEGWWSLLLRAERWSNPIETTIVLDGNKGLSETLKGDRAYLSAMTDESNSMETTINLERNKDLNESLLIDRICFSGTEWVLYSMWFNERW